MARKCQEKTLDGIQGGTLSQSGSAFWRKATIVRRALCFSPDPELTIATTLNRAAPR
jgi:hypothetical protein